MSINRLCTFMAILCLPLSALAQGSIFGSVTETDLTVPADSEVVFFGYIKGTDNEIHLSSSIGAGYETGNWFDDFQNFLDEAAGEPFAYHFFNRATDHSVVLNDLIPNNSFEQVDVQFTTTTYPQAPTNISAEDMGVGVLLRWGGAQGATVHIYRRTAASDGSFFRVDSPDGNLADHGVGDSEYLDLTATPSSGFDYVLIAEQAGQFSPPSEIVTPGICCSGGRGDIALETNCDAADGAVDILDLQLMIEHLFISFRPLCCYRAGDIAPSTGVDGQVDIGDLQMYISHLFLTFEDLPDCE